MAFNRFYVSDVEDMSFRRALVILYIFGSNGRTGNGRPMGYLDEDIAKFAGVSTRKSKERIIKLFTDYGYLKKHNLKGRIRYSYNPVGRSTMMRAHKLTIRDDASKIMRHALKDVERKKIEAIMGTYVTGDVPPPPFMNTLIFSLRMFSLLWNYQLEASIDYESKEKNGKRNNVVLAPGSKEAAEYTKNLVYCHLDAFMNSSSPIKKSDKRQCLEYREKFKPGMKRNNHSVRSPVLVWDLQKAFALYDDLNDPGSRILCDEPGCSGRSWSTMNDENGAAMKRKTDQHFGRRKKRPAKPGSQLTYWENFVTGMVESIEQMYRD